MKRIIEKMNTAKQRIDALKNILQQAKVDYYIVPTADYHNSEYPHRLDNQGKPGIGSGRAPFFRKILMNHILCMAHLSCV